MIDSAEVMQLIKDRRVFKIGARGIAITCVPLPGDRWAIHVSRASIRIECKDISILDDVDYQMLTFDINGSGEYHPLADLSYYDCVTVMR